MIENNTPPISLIFMAYNEAKTIEKEIRLFKNEIIDKIPGSEFIVAEDGSTDGTTQIIKKLVAELGIRHLTSEERKGYRAALLDAVNAAQNDWIFFSDTGLKHDPKDFWSMYEKIPGNDMIVGRKSNRTDQVYRKLFTWGYNFIIRSYFNYNNIFDCDSGFRLFNSKVRKEVFQSGKLFFKELPSSEIVIRTVASGLNYTEVPVSYAQREGVSRGLPPTKLPSVIYNAVLNLVKLKKEIREAKN